MSSPSQDIHRARSSIHHNKLGASQHTITYFNPARDEQHVSGLSHSILVRAMMSAGVKTLQITSTYRSPHDQARVMATNLNSKTSMYKAYGQQVENVGRAIVTSDRTLSTISKEVAKYTGTTVKPKLHTQDDTINAMTDEIKRLEGIHDVGCVSHHQINPAILNVMDIVASSVVPQSALAPFIAALTASPNVKRLGLPAESKNYHPPKKHNPKHFHENKHCIHVEIPQPNDANPTNGNIRYA